MSRKRNRRNSNRWGKPQAAEGAAVFSDRTIDSRRPFVQGTYRTGQRCAGYKGSYGRGVLWGIHIGEPSEGQCHTNRSESTPAHHFAYRKCSLLSSFLLSGTGWPVTFCFSKSFENRKSSPAGLLSVWQYQFFQGTFLPKSQLFQGTFSGRQ